MRLFEALGMTLCAGLMLGGCSQLTPEGERVAQAGECASCHGNPPQSGSHTAHAQEKGYGCLVCHPGFDAAGVPTSRQFHMNGAVDIVLTDPGGAVRSGTYNRADKTCGEVSCHGGGVLSWYAASQCGSCHELPPSTGGHQAHRDRDCGLCHLGYRMADSSTPDLAHVNGTVEVDGALDGGSYSTSDRTCTNMYCHGSFVGGGNARVSWTGAIDGCAGCHGTPPPTGAHQNHASTDCAICHLGYHLTTKSAPASTHINRGIEVNGPLDGGTFNSAAKTCENVNCHQRITVSWLSGSACGSCHALPPQTGAHISHDAAYDCGICHTGYRKIDTTSSAANHVNGSIDVDGPLNGGTYNSSTRTCASVYCHGNFTGGTKPSVVWTDSISGCTSCHGAPPSTGSHAAHASPADCGKCHQGYSPSPESVVAATHINGKVDVNGNFDGGTYSPADRSCSNVGCHSSSDARVWGISLSCGQCHALPPSSGAHAAHNRTYDCGICHLGYRMTDSSTSAVNHEDGSVNVNGPLNGGSYASADSSCANVYCHGNFAGGSKASVKWTAKITGCTACHAAAPTTGSHPTHSSEACDLCHAGYNTSTQTTSSAKHFNGAVDVDGNLVGATYNATTKTCSGGSCHGGASRTWGVASGACADCHTNPLSTGSHTKHRNEGYDCGECHKGYSLATSLVSSATHKNGSVEVNGVVGGGTFNSSDKTCSGVYCHGAFPGGNSARPIWGSGPSVCNSCHNLPPSRGSHQKHAVTYSYDCSVCHAGYTKTTAVAATHVDSLKTVNGTLLGGTFSRVDTSCSGTYCHGNFAGGSNAKAKWYGAPLGCSACHGTPPMTGKHDRHVTTRGLACDECHQGYDLTAQIAPVSTHANQKKEVVFKSGGSYNSATQRCSNVSCHTDHVW